MKNNQVRTLERVALAIFVAAAFVTISALAVHAPNSKSNRLARPFKTIQTDKVILFDGSSAPLLAPTHVTIQTPPISDEDRAATRNLKIVAKSFGG